MVNQRLEILFQKLVSKNLTIEERKEFYELLKIPANELELDRLSELYPVLGKNDVKLSEESSNQILQSIFNTEKSHTSKVINIYSRLRKTISYAAAILIFSIGITYFYYSTNQTNNSNVKSNQQSIILPGHKGAILKLSNGKSIILDSLKNGTHFEGFAKNKDAIIQEGGSVVDYATLITPIGRQEDITLSDGTKVWLNASSSLHFPTLFTGNQRIVEITGEAYFEVAHNANKPFIVRVGTEEIKVLGTHFNINAYADEEHIKTTLLQGKVVVNSKSYLKPGEQYSNGNISKVNTDVIVDWVFGYFKFDHSDTKTIMRQLARWYDIEIKYQGNISNEYYEGEIQKTLPLNDVLEILSKTGLHYKIDKRVLTITP